MPEPLLDPTLMNSLEPVIHRAKWMVVDSETIIENGFIRVENRRISEVGRGNKREAIRTVDHGCAILMPVLANVHTHLELSALAGQISFENGFRNWVRQLIIERESIGADVLIKEAKSGIRELEYSGCGLVGEISTRGLTREAFSNSRLSGVWFHELLGSRRPEGRLRKTENEAVKIWSLSGHGPHTTAPEILREIKQITYQEGVPFSIHLAESDDEVEFLTTGKGLWADFLTERGIDYTEWRLPTSSPVQYCHRLGLLDHHTIAVHLIHASDQDIELLAAHRVHVCLCLRSNANLHRKLPNVDVLVQKGVRLCLGTDSLASSESLNIFDEMAYLSKRFPQIAPQKIFEMATINGANALGLGDQFGTLIKGKMGKVCVIPTQTAHSSQIFENIINFGRL